MFLPNTGLWLFIHSFSQAISIAPLQSSSPWLLREALPTQHGHCVGVSRRSAIDNCEWKTSPRFLRGGQSGIRTHDPSDERRRIYQWATTPFLWLCLISADTWGTCRCLNLFSNRRLSTDLTSTDSGEIGCRIPNSVEILRKFTVVGNDWRLRSAYNTIEYLKRSLSIDLI